MFIVSRPSVSQRHKELLSLYLNSEAYMQIDYCPKGNIIAFETSNWCTDTFELIGVNNEEVVLGGTPLDVF